ncbi:MAG: monovalent cation/H+ antiporter complex subunit F [Bacteroidales bacterium]|jgi:multicomponent Na+:H+ antiporter subunit F
MDILEIAVWSGLAMLMLAFALAFLRLIKGPSVSDRIIAMDFIASLTMGFILLYSLLIENSRYFDIAVIISLISFIGTVAIATYIKQKGDIYR